MKKSSTNEMNGSLNSSNLGQDITQCVKLETLLVSPQQEQQEGQVFFKSKFKFLIILNLDLKL